MLEERRRLPRPGLTLQTSLRLLGDLPATVFIHLYKAHLLAPIFISIIQ